MTEMLDPYELTAPDQIELPVVDFGDFEIGTACNLDDTECEACQ
jgi:hypothetical protein